MELLTISSSKTLCRARMAQTVSAPGNDDFEVIAGDDHRLVAGTIEALDEC
jgi:hypothetical protein